MIRLRSRATASVVLLAFVLALTACSSDSDGGAAGGDGAQAAAATGGGSALMLDTPEYKLAQQFPLTIELTSTVFTRIRRIPIEYTCVKNVRGTGAAARQGEDKSPPLAWAAGPEGTKSFALIVDDPDAVEYETGVISPRVHWTIWNIPLDVTELAERVPTTTEELSIGPNTRQGANDYHSIGWSGPCPPPNIRSISQRYDPEYGYASKVQFPHGYMFKVYALDTELDVAAGANKNDLLAAMEGHILAGGELTGEYINPRLTK